MKLNIEFDKKEIGLIGLVVSSIGALISTVSITGYSKGYATSPVTGIHYNLAVISSLGFSIGMAFMIDGFVFQIIERVLKHNRITVLKLTLIIIPILLLVSFILYIITTKLLFR